LNTYFYFPRILFSAELTKAIKSLYFWFWYHLSETWFPSHSRAY